MQWMMTLGQQLRTEITHRPWHQRLSGDNLAWTHQLVWQSVEFTQTLGLQWGLSNDRLMRNIHASHAADEATHPAQLAAWMDHELLLVEAPVQGLAPTDATTILTAFNLRVAMREPLAVRVGVLNVLGEGVALDAFTRMIDLLLAAGRLTQHAKFWKTHKAIDGDHLQLGLAELGHVDEHSPLGQDVIRMMRLGGRLYGDMLDSWVY